MQNKDIFDFLKGLLVGADISLDFQYNQTIQFIRNNINYTFDYKNYLIKEITKEYNYRKNCLEQGKNIRDFAEFVSNLANAFNEQSNNKLNAKQPED